MNERIKELMTQATKVVEPNDPDYRHEIFDKEKFAELIVKECAKRSAELGQSEIGLGLLKHFGVEE